LEIISQQKKGKKVKLSQKRAANKLAIDNKVLSNHRGVTFFDCMLVAI